MMDAQTCKGCGTEKPLTAFRRHNRGGLRRTCRVCENAWVRTTKPWSSDTKRAYQKNRRNTHRGFALVADARSRAKRKGVPCTLDWPEVQKRIDVGVCEVTGWLSI